MFAIAGRSISPSDPPYVIAEISANHNGSLERAKISMLKAVEAGADAVKIQTYTPDTMTIDCDKDDFMVKGGLWDSYSLYKLYQEAHTPYSWHADLFRFAKERNIVLFSTPFDESAVDLLESLKTPAYKIASFEITDLRLIRYVAKKGKPMLVSTGMANECEVSDALETARSAGCNSILLFHCISAYPAPLRSANLAMIRRLKNTFGVTVGLSDHTVGSLAATTAVALGACAVEKHFTINRQERGPDSAFSIEPEELAALVCDVNAAWTALGTDNWVRPDSENESRVFRRSLYFIKDVKAGAIISEQDIGRIRPGYGLSPKHIEEVIGKRVLRDFERGDPVTWEAFSRG